MDESEKIKGKTIECAEVDGFHIYLVFNDGSTFEYDASDGGYSRYEYTESKMEGE